MVAFEQAMYLPFLSIRILSFLENPVQFTQLPTGKLVFYLPFIQEMGNFSSHTPWLHQLSLLRLLVCLLGVISVLMVVAVTLHRAQVLVSTQLMQGSCRSSKAAASCLTPLLLIFIHYYFLIEAHSVIVEIKVEVPAPHGHSSAEGMRVASTEAVFLGALWRGRLGSQGCYPRLRMSPHYRYALCLRSVYWLSAHSCGWS